MTGLDALKRINQIDSEIMTIDSIIEDIKPNHGLDDSRVKLLNKIIERFSEEKQELFDRLGKQSV